MQRSRHNLADWFLNNGGADSEECCQIFGLSTVVHQILGPWAQKCYTLLVAGTGQRWPWAFIIPTVVLYENLCPNNVCAPPSHSRAAACASERSKIFSETWTRLKLQRKKKRCGAEIQAHAKGLYSPKWRVSVFYMPSWNPLLLGTPSILGTLPLSPTGRHLLRTLLRTFSTAMSLLRTFCEPFILRSGLLSHDPLNVNPRHVHEFTERLSQFATKQRKPKNPKMASGL